MKRYLGKVLFRRPQRLEDEGPEILLLSFSVIRTASPLWITRCCHGPSVIFSQESRQSGMKKGGAKIGKKELSPQAHFSWMPERFPSGLPLKAPWLVLDYMAAREARRMDIWQRGTEPPRTA